MEPAATATTSRHDETLALPATVVTGGDAHDARPIAYIALPVVVPASREDGAVRAQSHGV